MDENAEEMIRVDGRLSSPVDTLTMVGGWGRGGGKSYAVGWFQ